MAKPLRPATRVPSGTLPASVRASARESLALTLTVAFAGLVVYASLYPFTGWFWPAGQPLSALLVPPWLRYHAAFDDASNFVGYLPLGALIYASALRRGRSARASGILACILPSMLSWGMEFTQHFLPERYPSLRDWTLNSLGACTGACLAIAVHAAGAGVRWANVRERWFAPRSGAVIALLLLWPVGFLFPSPIPFGQGVSWERLQEVAYDALSDHPLSPYFEWLWASLGEATETMSRTAEGLAIALGLLGPCLFGFTVTRRGWPRAALVPIAVAAGLAANTLSAALNFGPVHALSWLTSTVPVALACGAIVALSCVMVRPRAAAALGLVALSVQVALVAGAPSDPYYAESLQAWEQGRFIRFHGLAQWIGWLWPFVAGITLFERLVRTEPARAA